jgi:hypothetical protein
MPLKFRQSSEDRQHQLAALCCLPTNHRAIETPRPPSLVPGVFRRSRVDRAKRSSFVLRCLLSYGALEVEAATRPPIPASTLDRWMDRHVFVDRAEKSGTLERRTARIWVKFASQS